MKRYYEYPFAFTIVIVIVIDFDFDSDFDFAIEIGIFVSIRILTIETLADCEFFCSEANVIGESQNFIFKAKLICESQFIFQNEQLFRRRKFGFGEKCESPEI
jgi:hypothetical protein